jgi:hypothetical protein
MYSLALHVSSKAECERPSRVLHIEYAVALASMTDSQLRSRDAMKITNVRAITYLPDRRRSGAVPSRSRAFSQHQSFRFAVTRASRAQCARSERSAEPCTATFRARTMPDVMAGSTCSSIRHRLAADWTTFSRTLFGRIERYTRASPDSDKRGVSDPRWPRAGRQLKADTGVAHAPLLPQSTGRAPWRTAQNAVRPWSGVAVQPSAAAWFARRINIACGQGREETSR